MYFTRRLIQYCWMLEAGVGCCRRQNSSFLSYTIHNTYLCRYVFHMKINVQVFPFTTTSFFSLQYLTQQFNSILGFSISMTSRTSQFFQLRQGPKGNHLYRTSFIALYTYPVIHYYSYSYTFTLIHSYFSYVNRRNINRKSLLKFLIQWQFILL